MFLGKFVFYTHDPTCILWQPHYFRRMYYCGRQKDRQIFPALEQHRCFEMDSGINGTRSKSPNCDVNSSQQCQANGWSDFGMHWNSTVHKTLSANVLIMNAYQPTTSNVSTSFPNSCKCIHFFYILITGATTDIWESWSRLTSRSTQKR